MKLIFLDIDGVMNSVNQENDSSFQIADMDVEKLSRLKRLVSNTGANVVLTSARRLSKVYMGYFEKALDEFEILLYGVIRNPLVEDEDNKGQQINDFLINAKDKIDDIVILDDFDDEISPLFHEDFILVDRNYGFNEEIYQKSLEILNS